MLDDNAVTLMLVRMLPAVICHKFCLLGSPFINRFHPPTLHIDMYNFLHTEGKVKELLDSQSSLLHANNFHDLKTVNRCFYTRRYRDVEGEKK